MTYATVERVTLNKTTFELSDSSIYECHIRNGSSNTSIHSKIGFGHLMNGKIYFISGAYDKDNYGLPMPEEDIYPFGSITCNQNVIDHVKAGVNVKFYCVIGHYTVLGVYIMDSYKSVNINVQYVPQEPLALVLGVNVSNSTPGIEDDIFITGTIKNGGAQGSLKINLCIGYMDYPGEIIVLAGKWETVTGWSSNEERSLSLNLKVSQDMFDKQVSGKNIQVFCLGDH